MMTENDIRSLYGITRRIGDCVDHARWMLRNAIERTRHYADMPDNSSLLRLEPDDGRMLRLECTNQLRILSGITQSDDFRRIVDSCDWPIIRAIGGAGNEISLAEIVLRTSGWLESGMHHVLTWRRHEFGKAFTELEEIVENSVDMSPLMDRLTTEQGRLIAWAIAQPKGPGYLNIVLDETHRTITRVGSDIPPIELSATLWPLCKLFVEHEDRGIIREQLGRLPGEDTGRNVAISALRDKLNRLRLKITSGSGGRPRILQDEST